MKLLHTMPYNNVFAAIGFLTCARLWRRRHQLFVSSGKTTTNDRSAAFKYLQKGDSCQMSLRTQLLRNIQIHFCLHETWGCVKLCIEVIRCGLGGKRGGSTVVGFFVVSFFCNFKFIMLFYFVEREKKRKKRGKTNK